MSLRIDVASPGEPTYPRRLTEAGYGKPLHVAGRLVDCARSVAIVGARAALMTSIELAERLAFELAMDETAIISGGALGIDAAAHRGAIAARQQGGTGMTVAVLGCGIDVVYPERNRSLFEQISAFGGLLVSEFAMQAPPRRGHFVQRNKTIAALADAVVVVHAEAGSGSLYTARAAFDLGRSVMAVAGSPGCLRLIAEGAAEIASADDIKQVLAGSNPPAHVPLPAPDSIKGQVLAILHRAHSQDTSELANQAGLSVREVARALTGLELDGLAIPLPGQCYVRSALANQLLPS